MNKIVAIQADALSSINVKTDTTLLIALDFIRYTVSRPKFNQWKSLCKTKKVKFFENTKIFIKVSKIIKLNLLK